MKLTVLNKEYDYPVGVSLSDIAAGFAGKYDYPIILASVNGVIKELFKKPHDGDKIEFLDTETDIGNKTYARGLVLVLLKAINNITGLGGKNVRIMHKVGTGLYTELIDYEVTTETVMKIKSEMTELVKRDIPIMKHSVNTADARKIFLSHNMPDKERLFKYRRVSKVNVFSLEDYEDYFYGYMPISTGILKHFDIIPYEKGLMLIAPERHAPNVVPAFHNRMKLFNALKESDDWGRIMGITTVGQMNDAICEGRINDIILVQEAFMEKKIADIAAEIKSRPGVKFVMIAGPSSSGKTTFSHRLSVELKTLGFNPHPIGVDDYFKNREDTPKDADGNYNFECLEAIDVEGFNRDMTDLLAGKTVEIPSFNFKTGHREYKGNFKTLEKGDILVIEGIHGLNDELSHSLPKESKFKIYISALTQLNIDEHNRIPTTDARLIRRIVRDARTRGASAEKTISMWPSVRKGEEENIFPFQEGADVFFNSALIYELPELKLYAEPVLFSVPEDSPEYLEAKRLLKFLDFFLSAPGDTVPRNSVLREFIGGSCFPV